MEDEPPTHGVRGPRRGRGRGYVTVGRGLHRLAAPEGVEGVDLLRLDAGAWQLLLPESACFGGLTSAQLREWWLPPLPETLPLFVAQSSDDPASSRRELRVTRHPSTPSYDDLDGLRVMAAAETILACARDLRLLDLVVLIDCVLHHAWATLDELEEVAGRRRRGAPLMRKALTYADSRSESPYETLLRMLHVVCGIEVIPQYELFDEFGTLIAKGDLWLASTSGRQRRRPEGVPAMAMRKLWGPVDITEDRSPPDPTLSARPRTSSRAGEMYGHCWGITPRVRPLSRAGHSTTPRLPGVMT